MKQRPSGKVMTSILLVLGQMTFRWGLPPETFDIDIVALQIGPKPKRMQSFQPFIFSKYVSFREGTYFWWLGALDMQIRFFFEREKMCSCLSITHMGWFFGAHAFARGGNRSTTVHLQFMVYFQASEFFPGRLPFGEQRRGPWEKRSEGSAISSYEKKAAEI